MRLPGEKRQPRPLHSLRPCGSGKGGAPGEYGFPGPQPGSGGMAAGRRLPPGCDFGEAGGSIWRLPLRLLYRGGRGADLHGGQGRHPGGQRHSALPGCPLGEGREACGGAGGRKGGGLPGFCAVCRPDGGCAVLHPQQGHPSGICGRSVQSGPGGGGDPGL